MVAVTPSNIFNSAVLAVTPSKRLSSAAVDVIDVPFSLKFLPEARLMCSDEVQSPASPIGLSQTKVLSVAPLRVIPPPAAVTFVGASTDPNSIFLSSTIRVALSTVVWVPLTTKFPAKVTVLSAAMVRAAAPAVPTCSTSSADSQIPVSPSPKAMVGASAD